jgi:hypothetical protein
VPQLCGFCRRTDRSVWGSLHVAAADLRYGSLARVPTVLDLNPLVVSHWPAEAMRKLIEEAIQRVDKKQ